MVVDKESIMNIMGGMESSVGVRLHNHRTKLRQRFEIRKKLGQGTYGKVQLGVNKETGQKVAIKTIRKAKIETEADLIRIRREIQIMSSVQHPNIIHIYEVFENREKIVLVMEYAAGGELYDFLAKRKVLAEDEARRIFRQIATAVYYCHKHKICHRDLKLENILLDEDGNAKIADFGLSNVFGGTRLMETYCGSPLYASPEIVLGIPYHGPEIDCWSLGVLLYTLVYGAMPFDGSHFKRLVKQISEADYFEPKTPSPASPLIAIMLTVSSKKRADIVRICKHWWVNEGQPDCCLEIAEHLASQTPVRLDLLLSLAPPVTSENVVVTKDMETNDGVGGAAHSEGPVRSHSVDSIMQVDQNDLLDFMARKKKAAENHIGSGAKRDLTATSTAEGARASKRVARARPSTKKKVAADKHPEDAAEELEGEPLQRSESKEDTLAAATALAAEAAAAASAEAEEVKPAAEPAANLTPGDGSDQSSPSEPSVEEVKNDVNGEIQEASTGVVSIPSSSTAPPAAFTEKADATIVDESTKTPEADEPAVPPTKNTERRKSKIFETAEKFNSLAESKTAPEKNRKVFIPGVKVSDAKAAFERKSSLTPAVEKKPTQPSPPTTPPTPTSQPESKQEPETKPEPKPEPKSEPKPEQVDPEEAKREFENRKKVKDAVEVIGRKLSMKKKLSPLATNLSDSGSAGSAGTPGSPGSPSSVDPATGMKTVRVQVAPNDIRLATIQVSTPQASKFGQESPLNPVASTEEPRKSSKVEITLKSATLPRRKSSQSETPPPPVKAPSPERNIMAPRRASVGQSVPSYRSEVEHMVGGVDHPNRPRHQRSEVSFPVAAAGSAGRIHPSTVRSASLEPESKLKSRPREHIIPIRLEDDVPRMTTPPARPPVPPGSSSSTHLPYQRSLSARSTSLSRQSTQDSDTDSTVSASGGEPIRKSQREYIIPIAVEGGGYVTPRASSLEPGEDWSKTSGHSLPRSRLSRPKRMSSLFSESDDERESLNSEDRRSGGMDLHRLRSSRPTRRTLEHTDSLSSAEEEDDDEGFEILTAENLFSSLLSRVRSLTQRLNVEDGGRPGFPASRLLNQLHNSRAGSPFWTGSVFNRTPLEPLSRNTGLTTIRTVTTTRTRVSEATRSLSQDAENTGPTPWRRSVSRDTSDTESISSGTIPRGRRAEHCNSGDFSESSYAYSPSVSECLSAPTSRRSSRDSATTRRYTGGFSSARRAAKALEEELNKPGSYNRRLGRTLSMRSPLESQEKELPPLPYVPKRLSGYSSGIRNSTDGMTMSCPASTFSSRDDSVRSPSLLRSTSLSRDRDAERPVLSRYSDRRASAGLSSTYDRLSSGLTSDRLSCGLSSDRFSSDRLSASDRLSSGFSSDRLSSGYTSDRLSSILNSDRHSSGITSDRLSSDRLGPERATDRPILGRFLSERPVTESATLGRQSKGRRISRFLRPDFYDTPREASIYVKERDLMKDSNQEKETAGNRYGPVLEGTSQSRIESTIRSLRESSLGPKELDGAPTESSLLRRAVSVSDFNPNVKLGGYGDSSVPRRIPSYRKYTGTTSDTSLLLDGSNTEARNLAPSDSISKISSSATPLKKKRLSSKGTSSVGKKRVTTSPTKIGDDHKVVSDTGVSACTENKTEERPIIADVKPLTKSLVQENNEVVSKSEVSPTKVSKTRGSSSNLSVAGLGKVRNLSKKSGSTTDLTSATMARNGAKTGASLSDLPATENNRQSTVKTSGSTTNVSTGSSLPTKPTTEPEAGNDSGNTPILEEVNTGICDASVRKVTKERSSLKRTGSMIRSAATSTENSSSSKVPQEDIAVKSSGITNNTATITSGTLTSKDSKERSSVDTSSSMSNLAGTEATELVMKKVPRVRSTVKSSGSATSVTAAGSSEVLPGKSPKERGSIKTSSSKINVAKAETSDSSANNVSEERSPVKSSESATNLASIGSTKAPKERISAKTRGSTTNLAVTDADVSSANEDPKERNSVKSSDSTTNVSGIGNVEPGASKVSKERSSIKISGSGTNLTTDSSVGKLTKERSLVKTSGSRGNLATSGTSDLPPSKITKERSSVKRNGSITSLAGIDIPSCKVSKERSVSLKSGGSSNLSSTISAEPIGRDTDKSAIKVSRAPSITAVETLSISAKENMTASSSNGNMSVSPVGNIADSLGGAHLKAQSASDNNDLTSVANTSNSITKGSDQGDAAKSPSESRVGKITKLRSSVKSSRSKTNVSAVDSSDSSPKALKEQSAVKTSSSSTNNVAPHDAATNSVPKESSPIKSSGSSSNLSPLNKVSSVSKISKSTSETTSPRRVRSVTKMSDLSCSSLPKVPNPTRVGKNAEGPGKTDGASELRSSPTKMRSVPKPSGSMTDIPRTSPTKLRSLSKMGSSTERLNTSPTKLRTVGTSKASGPSTESSISLSRVPSASKLSRNATDSPRTVMKTSGSDLTRTSSTDSPKKVARSSSGLLPTESTQTSNEKVLAPSATPKKATTLSVRKSEADKKMNGSSRSVRSATVSPSVSPTKRLFGSLATSPIPGKCSSPIPGQLSPRPVHRRNSISQSVPTRRSSSHNRRGRSSSSVEPEDIPVISLKDVERRHRAMLLDRWSQSLQSLHLEREKAKAEAESKSEPKVELKLESQSEPKAEIDAAARPESKVETKPKPKIVELVDDDKLEIKLDGSKGRIPRLSSQSALNEASKSTATSKVPSCLSTESRPKTLSLKITPVIGADALLSPSESETLESPHSAVTSPASEDMESVSDRIRRKSFYSRFNDVKKKKRSPSASASSLLPSYTLTSRTHYPIEYTRSLSCGISGPEKARLLMPNGTGTSDDSLLRPIRKDRSPSWERSNMEIQNDFLFHNLGLHRFDPNNLSTDKETLFGMLSPTNEVAGSALGPSNSTSSVSTSETGEASASQTKAVETEPEHEVADVVVTLPPPKSAANKT